MGCRILYDAKQKAACLYCSTTDVAFGPLFSDTDAGDADERAEAFCRWLESPDCSWATYEKHPTFGDRRHDPRLLTDGGLLAAYSDWLAQEAEQWAREEAAQFAEEN